MKFSLAVKTALLFFTILLFAGCDINDMNTHDDRDRDHVYGSGRIISEERHVAECSGIVVKGAASVYLTEDDNQSIIIEADDNIMDNVITRRENGNLVVGLEDGSYSNITLKVYLSLRTIRELSIEGAGDIVVQQAFDCDGLDCIINGAGNINLKGTANNFYCAINGAGNIRADKFITRNCTAAVNGTGTCTLYVTEHLNASVNGVGTIYYYGDPAIVETSVTGLGKIQKR